MSGIIVAQCESALAVETREAIMRSAMVTSGGARVGAGWGRRAGRRARGEGARDTEDGAARPFIVVFRLLFN